MGSDEWILQASLTSFCARQRTDSQAEREHGLSVLPSSLHPESWRLCAGPRPRRRLTRTL